jgi:hypothetical protein
MRGEDRGDQRTSLLFRGFQAHPKAKHRDPRGGGRKADTSNLPSSIAVTRIALPCREPGAARYAFDICNFM